MRKATGLRNLYLGQRPGRRPWFLLVCHALTQNMMRSRQLTCFCQLYKSDQKHMSSQKVFTREAPTVSPKSLLISGAKNEPSGHGEMLLLK